MFAASEEVAHHSPWAAFYFVGLVVLTMFTFFAIGRRGLKEKVFWNPFTALMEQVYLFLINLIDNVIGPSGRKYLPMLATFWIFIFISNFYGLFLDTTPTADWSLNLGMAIVAILYVQYEGIKANGFFGHIRHFAGPKLPPFLIVVTLLLFVIEFVSEWMKLVSLSLRLYGNIHGGHEVVVNLNNLGKFSIGDMEIALPVGGLLLPIKLLTVVVQALVFTLLFTVYIALVTHHEDDSEHKDAHTKEAAHAHA